MLRFLGRIDQFFGVDLAVVENRVLEEVGEKKLKF